MCLSCVRIRWAALVEEEGGERRERRGKCLLMCLIKVRGLEGSGDCWERTL